MHPSPAVRGRPAALLRHCLLLALLALLALPCTGIAGQVLQGHVPAAVSHIAPIGTYTGRMHLALALPLRDPAGLKAFLSQLYDPSSPAYHHYLTPAQFTARFGPTQSDYQAVIDFAKSHGLTVTGTHPNRMLVDVEAPAAVVGSAFHVTIRTYPHPTESRTFYAPDRDPTIDLPSPLISHISGLDNYSLPRPRLKSRRIIPPSPSASSGLAPSVPILAGHSPAPRTGAGPSGTYMGGDFRAAYAPGVTLTGAGQSVGLLEFDGYTTSDITYYEGLAGITPVPLVNVLLDGATGNPSGTGGEVEVSLDIEVAVSMAPGASSVIVYESAGDWHDILSRMADDNLASSLSCSWYIPGGPADPIADQIFQQMAAQGQSFFSASGDYDAYTGLIPFPGDSPYITEVGGTTLTTGGPGEPWSSETVWNWDDGVGSGGGISTQYPIPSWQAPVSMLLNQGSSTQRNVPDVALTADNVYVRADGVDQDVGGTSCAAPLWAAFIALVNQKAATGGRPSLGFANPPIYTLGLNASYTTQFHDITTGNNTSSSSPAHFFATPGYDLCTGWGTPTGNPLINALAGPPDPLSVSQPVASLSGPAGGPFIPGLVGYTLTNSGSATLAWNAAPSQPWLALSSTSGSLAAGASVQLIASLSPAASSLAAGSYSALLFVTDVTSGASLPRRITLAVTGPAPALTVSPATPYSPIGYNGGPFVPTTGTFIVSNAGTAPMSWALSNTSSWLTVSPSAGVLGVGASSTVTVSLAATDSTLPAGYYSDTLLFSNLANGAGTIAIPALLSVLPFAPAITSATTGTAYQGSYFSLQVGATHNPTSFAASGLPAGLSINTTTGLISGSPFIAGTFSSAVSAINAGGTGTATFSFTVVPQPPLISSATSVSGTDHAPFSYQILADNNPLYYTLNSTLPSGLSFNSATGLISGTITFLGSQSFSVSAVNATGTGSATVFIDAVQIPPPVIQLNSFSTLASFNYSNGASPSGGLLLASDGNFYGVTQYSGTYGDGVAYKLTPAGVITDIAAFNYSDGDYPAGSLIQAPDGNLYGVTQYGGLYGWGCIYRLSFSGSLTVIHSFSYTKDGGEPQAGLLVGLDGKLYGTTSYGGVNYGGTAFKTTTSGTLITLTSFSSSGGYQPVAPLVQDSAGYLYGTTLYGGSQNCGTAFKLTPPGGLIPLFSFTATSGSNPYAGFTIAPGGTLFGAASGGGANSDGTIFSITTSGSLVSVASLSGTNGQSPAASLFQGPDGNWYGTAEYGGANSDGTLFQLSASGSFTDLHDFTGSDGYAPKSPLILGPDGALYGTTSNGFSSYGTVFRYTPSFLFAVVGEPFSYQINATNFPTSYSVSANLPAGLTLNPNTGLISGSTVATGTATVTLGATNPGGSGYASLFIVSILPPPPAVTSVLHAIAQQGQWFSYLLTATNLPVTYTIGTLPAGLSFNYSTGLLSGYPSSSGSSNIPITVQNAGGSASVSLSLDIIASAPVITASLTTLCAFNYSNGANPAAPILPNNGQLYGTASTGGSSGAGTVYTLSTSGSLSTLYSFSGGADGSTPWAPLTQLDTFFYGVACYGGTSGGGALYKVSASGSFVSLGSFSSAGSGVWPLSGFAYGLGTGLVLGADQAGGACGSGALYIATASGSLSTLYSFTGGSDGANPTSSPFTTTGPFLGTTLLGGTAGFGTVYSVTASGSLSTLHSFAGSPEGAKPFGSLTFGPDGNYYGTTLLGGSGYGTVYRVNTSGSFATIASFTGANGANPYSTLLLGFDGNFYGSTAYGGDNNLGTLFQVTPSGGITVLHSFTGASDGAEPLASLSAPNSAAYGPYYGTAYSGGTNGYGTAFAIVPPIMSGGVGSPITPYQVTATNSPFSFSATGLPLGLAIDPSLGIISGTPAVSGSFIATVFASNLAGSGSGAVTILTFNYPLNGNILPPATGIQGQPFNYQFYAPNPGPGGWDATHFPPGLSIGPVNTLISGTPTTPGVYPVTVTNYSGLGSTNYSLSLTIQTTDSLWKTATFGNGAPPTLTGDLVTNNPAGIPNLLAYALGIDPFNPSASALPSAGTLTLGPATYLTITFTRSSLTSDLTYSVEASPTLPGSSWSTLTSFTPASGWTPPALVLETFTPGSSSVLVRVQDSQPIGSGTSPSRFLRLRVSH